MVESPLSPSDVYRVDSLAYFPESETYDGLSSNLCTQFAEGALISADNPLNIGGVELIETNGNNYGYTGFAVDKTELESKWFQHRYASEDRSDLESLAVYLGQKIVGERNTGSKDGYWWAAVEEQSTWYNVRIYWSNNSEVPPRDFDSAQE
jgi:hypothetical protein